MSDATAILIAEAVRTAYAAAYGNSLISANIAALRINVNRPKLDDLMDWTPAQASTAGLIKVFVSTDDEEEDEIGREGVMYRYPIMVAIAARPATLDNVNVDPLHGLRQELKDYFFKPNAALPGREEGCIGLETIVDMDKTALRERRLFQAEFVLTFLGRRVMAGGYQ